MPPEYHAAYNKKYYGTPEAKARRAELAYIKYHDPREQIKNKARNAVRHAVTAGKISPLPCEQCGAPGEAHHDDYSRPLDVRWLCRLHHRRLHLSQLEQDQ